MAVKTREEYIESIRKQKPKVYVNGEKVENVVESPHFRTTLNHMAMTYDWANDPRYKDLVTFESPLINERCSIWTCFPDDLEQALQVYKTLCSRYLCWICLAGVAPLGVTYELEKETGIPYHQREVAHMKRLQHDDVRCCAGLTDPKGDRALNPSQQSDPDLYLRVVEKLSDGIIVRGAKAHTTNAPCANWINVAPSRVLGEEDKDYAISFSIPVDTPGITYICRPAAGPLEPTRDNPISSYMNDIDCISIFDDVFVPWENVFLCGEWQYTTGRVQNFAAQARFRKCACTSARLDLVTGVAALIAEYNGIGKASHVRSKLTDMMIASQIGYGSALAAARLVAKGDYRAATGVANAGCYHLRLKLYEALGTLMELAGGFSTTLPLEADFQNSETRACIEKFLKGKTGVPTQDRFRAFQLVHDLTASEYSGYLRSSILCSMGPPETQRVEVYRSYDLKERMEIAKALSLGKNGH
jgi:4-hydroxybutyryl-CoA dehydratase/vinylacetyl-CoA-Delta-isomerase